MKVGLAIGGSSTTGAAGVEADLKTFATFGVHSAVVITSVVSQNTKGVQQVFPLPPEVVAQQINSVFSDMEVGGIKIGLVGDEEVARIIMGKLKGKRNIVFDPVMTAQSDGSALVSKETVKEMKKLIGISRIVTPNPFEAERLTGVEVRSVADARRAAEALKSFGAEAVVIKGIVVGRKVFDVLLHSEFQVVSRKFVQGGTHGGGCCFSSALAACLINGLSIEKSFEETERFIDSLLTKTLRIGKGIKAAEPLQEVAVNSERWKVIQNLKKALREIESCEKFSSFIPEVGVNLVYALSNARGVEDVAGVVGRIRNAMGKPKSLGEVEFGASSHLARAVLKMMEFDPFRRAAINVKFSEEVVKKFKRMGMIVSSYEREKQPEEVKWKEGGTIQWGVEYAVKKGKIPDVIYHKGEIGKEPSVIIFGKDALSVARIALRLPKA
ncbi:MAG: bifunctional hydroxymethylpyrimidine kinase/phosphomethylpyrimidine kinase [Candidatus Micrarchaeia archaeon]